MKILAIDTTMQACSVAVLDTSIHPLKPHYQFEDINTNHAENIVPMMQSVMDQTKLRYNELSKIAVTYGPGAFTGVRIGMALAKGLALGLSVELSGFSSLHVMAQQASELKSQLKLPDIEQIIVATDAKRGELYCQLFDNKGHVTHPPKAIAINDFNSNLNDKPSLIVGNGTPHIEKLNNIQNKKWHFAAPNLLPNAKYLCTLAAKEEGTIAPFKPLYLREPDAKVQTKQIHINRNPV